MSYYELWGLNEEPFSTSPDPRFFYLTERHRYALNKIEIGIRLRKGLTTILGPIGSGKTTLSRALLQRFQNDLDCIFYFIFDPSFRTDFEFLHALARQFGIKTGRSRAYCKAAIQEFLFDLNENQKTNIVLVIDEAQKLNQDNLETLRTFLNYESNEYKFLQVILLGQPELYSSMLNMDNLMDRIYFKFALEKLTADEIQNLLYFRLKQAGCPDPEKRLEPTLSKFLWETTNGLPRRITHLCHLALTDCIIQNEPILSINHFEKLLNEEKHFHEQFAHS